MVTGIKYTKNAEGVERYVRIDLEKHGGHQLIEDFLDGMEAMACKGEPTVPLREFNRYIEERLKADV